MLKASHPDDEELREVLSVLPRAIRGSPPREVSVKYRTPVLLATDVLFDELTCGVARAGVGGILIGYFAGVLSDSAVHESCGARCGVVSCALISSIAGTC